MEHEKLIEVLRLQVAELEKLVAMKDTRIRELELQRMGPDLSPPVIIPYMRPVQWQCVHEYPNPWDSITPPTCKKCGMQAPQWTLRVSLAAARSGTSRYPYLGTHQAERLAGQSALPHQPDGK